MLFIVQQVTANYCTRVANPLYYYILSAEIYSSFLGPLGLCRVGVRTDHFYAPRF